jgi:hypothetical protein
MTDTTVPVDTVPIVLPDWTDPESIATFVISAFTLIAGTLAATGVIIPAGLSASAQGWAAVAGYVIALGVQAWNSWRISRASKAAIAAGFTVARRMRGSRRMLVGAR